MTDKPTFLLLSPEAAQLEEFATKLYQTKEFLHGVEAQYGCDENVCTEVWDLMRAARIALNTAHREIMSKAHALYIGAEL